MKSLLIVYHSQSGASAELAAAAMSGASGEAGVEVKLMRAWDAGSRDLLAADALLLVAAENSATLSGGIKDFLDRSFYPVSERGGVTPAALIISAGNDGRGAQAQCERIFRGYPLPLACEALIVRGEPDAQGLQACEELGAALAAGVAMGIF